MGSTFELRREFKRLECLVTGSTPRLEIADEMKLLALCVSDNKRIADQAKMLTLDLYYNYYHALAVKFSGNPKLYTAQQCKTSNSEGLNGAEYDDLLQLCKATMLMRMERFDTTSNLRFVTFCRLAVNGALIDYCNSLRSTHLDGKTKRAGSAVYKARKELTAKDPSIHGAVSDQAIADHLGWSIDDVYIYRNVLESANALPDSEGAEELALYPDDNQHALTSDTVLALERRFKRQLSKQYGVSAEVVERQILVITTVFRHPSLLLGRDAAVEATGLGASTIRNIESRTLSQLRHPSTLAASLETRSSPTCSMCHQPRTKIDARKAGSLCQSCYAGIDRTVADWSSDEDMLKLLETQTITSIAKLHDVSTAAVRKHCKRRGLR